MNRREKIEAQMNEASAKGDYDTADRLYRKLRRICQCGADAYEQHDHYGIYAGMMCDKCFRRKYKQGPYFDSAFAGESLEPEEY